MNNKISRRNFIRITAASAAAVAIGAYGFKELLSANELQEYKETRPLLGTFITLKIISTDQEASKTIAEDAFGEIKRLESILSRHDPASEVSILNFNGSLHNASGELIGALEKAKNIQKITGGAFDPTVLPLLSLYEGWNWQATPTGYTPPDAKTIEEKLELVDFNLVELNGRDISLVDPGMSITLDGVAKGYIVDQSASLLRSRGLSQVLVAASGDMSLAGMRQDGKPWKIGITDPRALDPEEIISAFSFTNGCIATSGDYEHAFTADFSWNHIIDPRVGHSPRELASATVIAGDAATADALATSAMVLGVMDSLALFNKMPNVQAYLIGKDLKTYSTRGFSDLICA